MAALYGCGIDNCVIELSGEEFPILDGSARYYVEEIQKVGIEEHFCRQLARSTNSIYFASAGISVFSSRSTLTILYPVFFRCRLKGSTYFFTRMQTFAF